MYVEVFVFFWEITVTENVKYVYYYSYVIIVSVRKIHAVCEKRVVQG